MRVVLRGGEELREKRVSGIQSEKMLVGILPWPETCNIESCVLQRLLISGLSSKAEEARGRSSVGQTVEVACQIVRQSVLGQSIQNAEVGQKLLFDVMLTLADSGHACVTNCLL